MAATGPDQSAWIRRLRPAPSGRVRLVCLPHAGGAATFFHPMATNMPQSVEVLGVQYPGRQDRRFETCIDDLHEMAMAIVAELCPWSDAPIALLGHSMGALVAYEVARAFEQEHGVVPVTLFVSGQRAPSRHRNDGVHQGGDRSIVREAIRLDASLEPFLRDEDFHDMVMPALRADFKASETYVWRPSPPLTAPIRAFHGDRDPKVDEIDVAAWAEVTTGTFELKVFPGGHFFIRDRQASVIDEVSAATVPVPNAE